MVWKGKNILVDARGQRRMGRLSQADRRATLTEITTHYTTPCTCCTCTPWSTRTILRWMGYSSRRPPQQDNAPCHKAWIISNCFLEHENEFTVLKWPPQSPDHNQIEHFWDVVVERELSALDVHPTNLYQLQDAILSIWVNISKEYFQHFVESMPHRFRPVLKAKGGQTPLLVWCS